MNFMNIVMLLIKEGTYGIKVLGPDHYQPKFA